MMRVKNSDLRNFLSEMKLLFSVRASSRYSKWVLPEYPFDSQLLTLSRLYRESRKLYLAQGGSFASRVCSVPRSLSSHDLFKDEIEYTPIFSELAWFVENHQEVLDSDLFIKQLSSLSAISVFHEQNHRILWRLLPPPPIEEKDFCRYLNFAESLVIVLDLVLGDEIGGRLSPVFEKYKIIYRPGGRRQVVF
ncbi:MAG: hypothetical protein KUL82_05105 [Bdellovibrio sp.]|nr:hypothetical protein [Bdellovibrio sp.]